MAMEGRSVAGARLRPVAPRLDRSRLYAPARAVPGDNRLRAGHLGAVAGGDPADAHRRSVSLATRHDRRRRTLRAHRAAARDCAGAARLLGLVMRLQHARTALELHELSGRNGPALLLLHALGGSGSDWSEVPALWPGRVYALDFCGHGRSEWMSGGVYLPEILIGDADVALAHIGVAAIAGAGIGAYAAALLAGGRRKHVPAALLLPGHGLDGGGP